MKFPTKLPGILWFAAKTHPIATAVNIAATVFFLWAMYFHLGPAYAYWYMALVAMQQVLSAVQGQVKLALVPKDLPRKPRPDAGTEAAARYLLAIEKEFGQRETKEADEREAYLGWAGTTNYEEPYDPMMDPDTEDR